MKNHLASLIKINGSISVSEFMNEALFNPRHGYYTTQDPSKIFGKKGDFTTASEISQVFGELIGAYLVNIWQNNYGSQKIRLVEMGAGRGTLMKDLLNFAKKIPGFLENVEINIIEISPNLQVLQKENLNGFKINWWNDFASFAAKKDFPIFFIANELFDCFAINQFVKTKNGWQEKLVALNQADELEFILAKENPAISKIISDSSESEVNEGAVFEYSAGAAYFMEELSKTIKICEGVGIIIDYGYIKNEFKNTLQAVKNHQYSNVLEKIGNSDITALVNFNLLENIARKSGLKTSLITQKVFLESLGIEIRRKKLIEGKSTEEQNDINSRMDRLIAADQMGELFKVLIIYS